jgi:hypothetical protein
MAKRTTQLAIRGGADKTIPTKLGTARHADTLTDRSFFAWGQSTIEMVVIFAGMLFVMVAILAVIPGQTTSVESVRAHQTAQDTVDGVAQAANDVYLAGEGAQRTVWVELPDSYDATRSFIGAQTGVTDWGKRKVVDIYAMQTGDVFALSRAPICGTWPDAIGRYQVVLTYNSTAPAHVMVNASC